MASWPLAFQKSIHGDLGRRGLYHPWGAVGFPATGMARERMELPQLFPPLLAEPDPGVSSWGCCCGCSTAA